MNNKNKIKILIVEHNITDIEFIENELKNGGINYVSKIVENEKDYQKALINFIPDIILCDFVLPSFSGDIAFEIKERIVPDIPFLFVSGSIGEEKSIEYIKNGVTDYVLKDKLFTLTVKVKRALKEAKEKQEKNRTERELAQSETFLARAQKIAHLGSWELNFTDNVIRLSVEGARIFGFQPDQNQLSYDTWSSLVHPADIHNVLQTIKESKDSLKDTFYQYRIILKDGAIRHIYSEAKLEFDSYGKPIGMYGIMQDVTDKVIADALREFEKIDKEALINSTEDLIWSVSKDFKLIASNKAFIQSLETMSHITLKPGDDLLMEDIFNPDSLAFWKKVYIKALSGKSFKEEIYTPSFNNWKESWADISFNPVYKDDAVIAIACYSRNITERKLAEEKISKSEARLSDAQTIAKVGSWETDLLTFEVIWSDETCSIFGIENCHPHTSHENFLKFVYPGDKEKVDKAFLASLKSTSLNYIEHRIITPGGIVKAVEERWHIVNDNGGKPMRAIGTVQDITERKHAEEKLKESELRYRSLIEQATDAIYITDASLKFIDMNQYGYEVSGYTLEEALQLSLPDILFPEDLAGNPIKVNELKLGKTIRNERRLKRKDGTAVDMEVSTKLMEDGRLIMFGHDITERKQAEQLVSESEAKFRAFFENSLDGILLTVTDGNILAANPSACEIFRMTEEEICTAGTRGIIDLKDPRTEALIKERKRTGKAKGELTYLRKDGSKFPGEISSVSFKDSYGLERTSMIIRDTSERKRAEEKLAVTSSELQHAVNDLNKIMDSSLDVICAVDAKGYFVKVSAASEAVWGYTPKELIGKPLFNFVYHEDNEITHKTAGHVMKGNNLNHFENRYIHKDGSLVPVEWSARWDEKDQIRYGVARDVTEKKKLERAFQTERNRLNDLFTQAPTSMGILKGANHVYEMVNPLYLELIGKQNIIGKTVKEILPEIIEQGFIKLLDHVYETGETFSTNEMLIKIDQAGNGELVDKYLNFIYQAYKNIHGNVEGIFFFAIDVTEQVLSRKKIEESENRFRALIEKSTDMKTLSTIEGEFIYISPSITKLFGYSLKEILNTFAFDIIHPDDIKEFAEKRKTILQIPGKSFHIRLRFRHKNGNWIWCEGTVTNMLDEPGINALVSNFRDVSEKIEGEAQKEFDSNNLSALINNTSDLMWSVDRDFNLITSNQPFDEMGKVNFGKTIPKGGNVLLTAGSPEMRSHFKDLYERAFAGEAFTEISHFEYPVEFWTEISYYPIRKGDEVIGTACHSRDITELKRGEENLKQSEARLKEAQAIGQIGNWEIDMITNITTWSDELYNIFGIKKHEVQPSTELFFSFLHPDDINELRNNLEATMEDLKDSYSNVRFIRKNGSLRYAHIERKIEVDAGNKPIRLYGILQDITKEKLAENSLKQSENRFREFFDSAPETIVIFDIPTFKFVKFNDNAAKLFKYSAEELLKKGPADISPEFQPDGSLSEVKAKDFTLSAIKGNKPVFEWMFLDANGKEILCEVRLATLTNVGSPQLLGSFIDITERKNAELKIKESELKYRSLIEQASDTIIVIDTNGSILEINSRAEKLFGYTRDELLKMKLKELIFAEDPSPQMDEVGEGQAVVYERRIKRKDETPVDVEVSARMISDGRILGIFRDISERKKGEKLSKELNNNLQKQAIELTRSNEELEQFAYVASHDLQEPLRMVTSFLTQLEKKYGDVIDDKGKKYIEFAVDGAKRMRQIILDLLEFSRVGRIEDKIEIVDLNQVVEEIQILFRKQVEEKSAVLYFDKLPLINSYNAPIRQVFQNLIGNALKYTHKELPAKINITVEESDSHWQFAVADNGIGIAKEYFDKIFIIFQRLHNKDEFSGTGMGLAVTKKIIENLGGKIWVKSEEDRGSTFYFTLSKT